MTFTVEALVIAIFAILPGFVSSAARSVLKPGEVATAGEWVAGSIVTSLALNAVVLFVFILLHKGIDLSQPVINLKQQLSSQSGSTAVWYAVALYGSAVAWGILSGFAGTEYAPRALAYRLRLTPVAPAANVFNNKISELVRTKENIRLRGSPHQEVPWLRIQRKELTILGRLQDDSVLFNLTDPIEVFLYPSYIFERNEIIARPEGVIYPKDYQRGLYLRVLVDDLVEVIVAPAVWDPTRSLAVPFEVFVVGS